ncbi:MAG: diguanylate cyclase [Sedimenticola sp.]
MKLVTITWILCLLFLSITIGKANEINPSPDSELHIFSRQEQEWIKDNPKIPFTGDPNWLPYEAFTEDGVYIGIVADHLKIIEHKTGLKFSPIPVTNWTESLRIANQGNVWMISGDAADTILNKAFIPVQTYSQNPIVIVMGYQHNYVERLDEIKGKRIAIIKDYGYTADIFNTYPNYNFIEVENIQEGLNGVVDGTFDAILATMALASYHIAEMGLHNIKVVGKTPIVMDLTLFVAKEQVLLQSIIRKALQSISIAESQDILQSWIRREYVEKTDYRLVIEVTLSLVLILVIILIWNRRLQREIRLRIQSDKALRHTQNELSEAQHLAKVGSWIFHVMSRKFTCSDETCRIFEIDHKYAELTYDTYLNTIHPDDRRMVYSSYINARKKKQSYRIQHRLLLANGKTKWIEQRGEFPEIEGHENQYIRGTVQDISQHIDIELRLKKSNDKFQALTETTRDFVWEITADYEYTYCSPQVTDIFGHTPDDLLEESFTVLRATEEAERIITVFRTAGEKKEPVKNLETVCYTKEGMRIVTETSAQPYFSESGKLLGYRGIDRDITDRKRTEEKLKQLATHDALTGLYNRRILEQRIVEDIERSARYERQLSVLMLDIDHFKVINDTYGHQVGDAVLRGYSEVLQDTIRQTDYAARYGGEEFVIILMEVAQKEAKEMAERLREKVADHPIQLGNGKDLHVTSSIGIATFPEHGKSWEGLLHAADSAMYTAKKMGRNKVIIS